MEKSSCTAYPPEGGENGRPRPHAVRTQCARCPHAELKAAYRAADHELNPRAAWLVEPASGQLATCSTRAAGDVDPATRRARPVRSVARGASTWPDPVTWTRRRDAQLAASSTRAAWLVGDGWDASADVQRPHGPRPSGRGPSIVATDRSRPVADRSPTGRGRRYPISSGSFVFTGRDQCPRARARGRGDRLRPTGRDRVVDRRPWPTGGRSRADPRTTRRPGGRDPSHLQASRRDRRKTRRERPSDTSPS